MDRIDTTSDFSELESLNEYSQHNLHQRVPVERMEVNMNDAYYNRKRRSSSFKWKWANCFAVTVYLIAIATPSTMLFYRYFLMEWPYQSV
uniref:Uncharacterized protein n=1 Tax=Ciona intestinalis TaxID=7719 RepID=H2Y1J3_CIOIN